MLNSKFETTTKIKCESDGNFKITKNLILLEVAIINFAKFRNYYGSTLNKEKL